MNKILIYTSIFFFALGIYHFALVIFKIKDYRIQKLTLFNLKKIEHKNSKYKKLIKKCSQFIDKKNLIPNTFKTKFQNMLNLCKLDIKASEYICSSLVLPILLIILSLIFIFIYPFISICTFLLAILLFMYKVRGIYQRSNKIKEDIESNLSDLNRFIQRKINETSDVFVILSSYLEYSSSHLKDELLFTLSEMKISNVNMALLNLEKRINSNMLSDIIHGLLTIYSGEDNKEYFALNEVRFNSYMQNKLDSISKGYSKRVKIMTIISLGLFISTYFVVMVNILKSSLALII